MWRYGAWTAPHPLPIGVSERAAVGEKVQAGQVVANGATLGTPLRVEGARRLGLTTDDFARQLRAHIGADVTARAVLARVGRRFARSVTSPIDGRLLHLTADGDLQIAPIVGRWNVRSTLDGVVTRSDDAMLTIEGSAWCLEGVAAYGPDAIGDLTIGLEGESGDISPARVDARLAGRIVVGAARVSAEVMTRAHACGVAGLVAAAAPASGLRVVYGEAVTATGDPGRDDRPTVLCLMGFGSAALPREVLAPMVSLSGVRAAIHTASARLYVFAAKDAIAGDGAAPSFALSSDYSAIRSVDTDREPESAVLPSGVRTTAIRWRDELVPTANVRPFTAR